MMMMMMMMIKSLIRISMIETKIRKSQNSRITMVTLLEYSNTIGF